MNEAEIIETENKEKSKKKKEPVVMSVVTLPLKTEIWQADKLGKKFEMCRSIYNAMLGYELKKYRKMTSDDLYQEVQKKITEYYQNKDKSVRESPECKAVLKTRNDIIKMYGFTKFGFTNDVTPFYRHFKENISSEMAGRSIAIPMWTAFEKLLYGNGEMVHFKKAGDWNSIATSGRSGFRVLNADGERLECGSSYESMFLAARSGQGKKMYIPIILPKGDTFKAGMMERPIKAVRVTRKLVRGKYKYFVQLTVEGLPAPKLNADGESKHKIGSGAVGIYIDTRRVTVATPDGQIRSFALNEGIERNHEKEEELQRLMSASRLHNNPGNFDEDGKIRKGRIVEGQRMPLEWHISNRYKVSKSNLANLRRVESENRLLERQKLANVLLELGDTFAVNDYPFALAAMRKKRDELKKDGTPKSKAKAGKTIGENAPSMLITLLDQKLAAAGKRPIERIVIDNVEKKGEYREKYAKEMLKAAMGS